MKIKNKGITVTGLMRQSAKYNANRISIIAGDRRLTYAEAWNRGVRLANGFLSMGWIIKPRPHLAPKTAPIYALGMGFGIGIMSEQAETMFPGIVIQAVSLTFFVAASLLFAYKSGVIKPNQNFLLIIFSATVGIFLTYIANLIFSAFTGASFSFLTDNGAFGIGISLFVVAIAALNLVLDFDIIEQAHEQGAPKYIEWFGAMALVATLIWLYIEILRLLMKLRSR